MKKYHKAFTLAEVLITLGIIGVVAAMTIPTLINNSNSKALASQYKEDYSIIANAVKMMQNDYGSVAAGINYSIGTISNLGAYIKYAQICPNNARTEGCAPYVGVNAANLKLLDGEDYWWTSTFDAQGAIMQNGSVIVYNHSNSACQNMSQLNVGVCGSIIVDVNGPKSPNVFGRDIFEIYITENGVCAQGACGDVDAATPALGCRETGQVSVGETCGVRILKEGAENY